jgi:hypothetical protein
MSDWMIEPLEPDSGAIDVEQLMAATRAELRRQLLARAQGLAAGPGRRFPSAYYDHIYQASILVERPPALRPAPATPYWRGLFGYLLRRLFPGLITFYAATFADRQADVNRRLLAALNLMGQTLEAPAGATPPASGGPPLSSPIE